MTNATRGIKVASSVDNLVKVGLMESALVKSTQVKPDGRKLKASASLAESGEISVAVAWLFKADGSDKQALIEQVGRPSPPCIQFIDESRKMSCLSQ